MNALRLGSDWYPHALHSMMLSNWPRKQLDGKGFFANSAEGASKSLWSLSTQYIPSDQPRNGPMDELHNRTAVLRAAARGLSNMSTSTRTKSECVGREHSSSRMEVRTWKNSCASCCCFRWKRNTLSIMETPAISLGAMGESLCKHDMS